MTTRITGKKRQRSENWVKEDKMILKELVRQRVRAIENKNTDTNSNVAKVAAWNDLRERFNRNCRGTQRTIAQLKAQWGLLKLNAKKRKDLEKEISKTDGGLPQSPTSEVITSEDISSWLHNDFNIDSNEFDSDHLNQRIWETDRAANTSPPMTSRPRLPANTKEKVISVETTVSPPPSPMPSRSSGPAHVKKKIYNAHSLVQKMSICEIKCRKELHAMQMKNEIQKNKNLKLKEMLIKELIKYYQNRNK